MSTGIIRVILLYIVVVFSLRIMGKRQIGELQPSEFAITLIIAELATIPMQDAKTPLINGIIPIIILFSVEVFMSYLLLKSRKIRSMFTGTPLILINKGKIQQYNLKRARINIDDLMEELRLKDYPDIAQVQYAIMETNGELSIIPKSQQPTENNDGLPLTIINDGQIDQKNMDFLNLDENWIDKTLDKYRINKIEDIFIMTVDEYQNIYLEKKRGEDV